MNSRPAQPLDSSSDRYSSSCLIPTPATYTQYRPCEQASTSTTYSSTFTYTVGRPGKTSTVDLVETITRTKSTTAPFPTACPAADNVSLRLYHLGHNNWDTRKDNRVLQVDYVASDRTAWERGCGTGVCFHFLFASIGFFASIGPASHESRLKYSPTS